MSHGLAQIQLAMDISPGAMLVVNPRGEIALVNEELERLLGYAREELLGRPVETLVPARAGEAHAGERAAFFAAPEARAMGRGRNLTARAKDGGEIPVEIALKPVPTVGGLFVLATVVDLRARARAEQRFVAAVESSPSGMVMVDAEGRIVLLNREVERLFGWTREELLGRPIETLVPERFRAAHPGFRASFHAEPHARSMGTGRELRGLRRDGSEIPVEIGLNPVRTDEGLFVLASIVDITARQRAERELREAQDQLLHSQKMEAIGTLAGGIAHDFNNILAGIVGFAEMAQRRAALPPAAASDLREILTAAERGRQLVRRILAFSRRAPSAPAPMHLAEPVEEAVRFLRASLPSKVEIRTELDPATPAVSTDATQVHQILMNLATNAAHAMPEGGVIEVRLSPVHVDTTLSLRHPGLSHGPHARLVVRDSGAGMPPEIAARAFEPFFTTKAPGSGTGLGLSVIHGIVRSSGGAIGLSSAPGRGTTVEVYLPAVAGSAVLTEAEPGGAERGRGERLLVVDDEEMLGRLLRGLLEESGYRVTVRQSGAEALEAFRASPDDFDLVLTDLTMPAMGGVALGEAVHALRPEVPVLLMSGYIEGVAAADLERSGAKAVLAKPVRIAELSRALRAALTAA